jgi:hypothetical protein
VLLLPTVNACVLKVVAIVAGNDAFAYLRLNVPVLIIGPLKYVFVGPKNSPVFIIPPKVEYPLTLAVPLTSNLYAGDVIPIPTLPVLSTTTNVFDPLIILNILLPAVILAVTAPSDICDKLNPAILEAEMYEAVIALVAQLEVPNNEPVNP